MNSQINIIETEELTQDTIESEERTINNWISELGNKNAHNAIEGLTSILRCLSDNSRDNDVSDRQRNDYCYHCALYSLLQNTIVEPETKIPDDNPTLRKTRAVIILTNMYPLLLERDPEGAFLTAKTLMKKLSSVKEITLDTGLNAKQHDRDLVEETVATLAFFKTIAKLPENQSNEIVHESFSAIFDSLKRCNFTVFSDQDDLLKAYLINTLKNEDYELFNSLVNIFLKARDKLNLDKKQDRYVFLNTTHFNYSLISMKEYIPTPKRLKLNKILFNRTLAMICHENDADIRDRHLNVLSSIISKQNVWNQDPKLANQEVLFHLEILDAVMNIVSEKDSLPNGDKYSNELRPYRNAYEILGELLEQYALGVIEDDPNWLFMARDKHSKFKKALNIYLNGLNKGNNEINMEILHSLEEFLSPTQITNPKHPLRMEGIKFYADYFSKQTKGLKKDSRQLISKAKDTKER